MVPKVPLSWFVRFFPAEWRRPCMRLLELRLARRSDALIIGFATTLAVAFESFGIAMLYPVLDYIGGGGDVAKLAVESRMWRTIVATFQIVHLPVTLLTLCLIVLALVTLREAISVWRNNFVERVRARMSRDLTVRCFNELMHAKAEYLQQIGSGQFAYVVNVACDSSASIIRNLAGVWNNIVIVTAYASVMFLAAPIPTLLAVAFGFVLLPTVNHLVHRSRLLSDKSVRAKEQLSQSLTGTHGAWRLVKLSGAVDLETERVSRDTGRLRQLGVDLAVTSGKMQLILVPLQTFFALATIYVSFEVLGLNVATITLLFVAVARMLPVFKNFANLRQSIVVIDAVLERAAEAIRSARANREEQSGRLPFHGCEREIKIDNVRFAYTGAERAALEGVSVRIPAGKMTAIIGPTGAGKSTLVDLIPRLIEPSSGEVYIDDVRLQEFDLATLRARIGFVTQTPLILEASISDNVRYGLAKATQVEIEDACRNAHADEFIRRLPQGYETVLGEGGSTLSGGQRQRLALARAFLRRATILILDEPTSSLDYETEHKIQTAMEDLRTGGKTTLIVIAHRLSTIHTADQIIVLDRGRVSEIGTPAQLKHDEGWFKSMLAFDAGTYQETEAEPAGAA
jgi:subfamily B ATP-binding cassette protein MsbA